MHDQLCRETFFQKGDMKEQFARVLDPSRISEAYEVEGITLCVDTTIVRDPGQEHIVF